MSDLDMTASTAPKSDQKNADDFLTGPQTFEIEKVTKGSVEQPFNFHLVGEPGKPYKPSKSMRRVMVAAWGTDASAYVGHSLTLYCDPTVKFGGEVLGGIKISHMTGLAKTLNMSLTASKGKKALHRVEPLTIGPTRDQIAKSTDLDQLREWWSIVPPSLRPAVESRSAELKAVTSE